MDLGMPKISYKERREKRKKNYKWFYWIMQYLCSMKFSYSSTLYVIYMGLLQYVLNKICLDNFSDL